MIVYCITFETDLKKPKCYWFRDRDCLGRECFRPGERVTDTYRHKKTMPLTNLTYRRKIHICTNLYDYKCDNEKEHSEDLHQERIEEGWRSRAI